MKMDMKQLIGKMDEIEEGAKPDFLDMDKDGDKEEPMKKAVADKEKGAVKEAAPASISDTLAAKKIADKIRGTPDLSIPKIKQYVTKYLSMVGKAPTDVDYLAALVSTELENQGMNESLVVQADGEEAAALLGMLRLAGMAPQHEEPTMEERDIEYTNTPDERIAPHQAAVPAGNDLNKSKTMIKHSYRQGDNPFAMAETAMLEKKLRGMFESMLSENSK